MSDKWELNIDLDRWELNRKLYKAIREKGISCSDSSFDLYIDSLEMAIEDNSKYIYVSDGWEDHELEVSEILK